MTETNVIRPALFRTESLRERQLAWQGRPAVALRFPTLFVTLVSVAIAAATAALITFGGYARRVDMEGAVLPNAGVIEISALSPGRIKALAVKEGETVHKQALLYTIDVDTATKDGGMQQQIIDTLNAERQMLTQEIDRKTQMSQQGKDQLQQKIEAIKTEISKVGAQITVQQTVIKQVSDEYLKFSRLVQQRLVSLDELNIRYQNWMQALARLEDVESGKLRLEGELKDAESQLTTTTQARSDEIDTLKSRSLEINEKLATSEAHQTIEIRAPIDGVVTTIVAYPGQTVAAGGPMLKIVPRHAPMEAELLAPSNAIGFIREGRRVRLRYSAFPYQKYGEYWGTITSVSRAAMSVDEVRGLLDGAPPKNQNGPFYRILVAPDSQALSINGEEHSLPAGMEVEAYALLDRRPLYQWILEPLYEIGRAAHGS
jgi:membrane fusion protein